MERTAWSDERLDDAFRHVDQRFDQVDARFDRVEGDIRELRVEMRTGFAGLRAEFHGDMNALRVTFLRIGGGMMAGLVGVIATVLAAG